MEAVNERPELWRWLVAGVRSADGVQGSATRVGAGVGTQSRGQCV